MNLKESPFRKVAPVILSLSIAASACADANTQIPPTPKPKGITQIAPDNILPVSTPGASPAPESPSSNPEKLSDSQVLEREVKRLGIAESAQEEMMWTNAYPQYDKPLPLNETTFPIGRERVRKVISLMQQSQNPHLREAGKLLDDRVSRGNARILFYPRITSDSHEGAFAITLVKQNEKLLIEIGVSLDAVLNRKLDSTMIAILLAHEAYHAKSTIDFQNGLPRSYTTQQRYEKEKQRLGTKEKVIFDEAIAYGKQAEAYIYQYGLGYKDESSLKRDASMFVRLGSDATDPKWQDYVRKEILSY